MASYDITTFGTPLEFDTQNGGPSACVMVDATHALVVWQGVLADGFAQVFAIDGTTFAVTTAGAPFEFDTQNLSEPRLSTVDTNHFLCLWRGQVDNNDLQAQVLTVNTTTWAVTTSAALTTVDASVAVAGPLTKVDTNHWQTFWRDSASGDGFTKMVDVNTTTFAVTALGTALEFDAANYISGSCVLMDANHTVATYTGNANDGFAQSFAINTTTWEITTAASGLEFDTQQGNFNTLAKIDDTHVINCWQDIAGDGQMQVFAVNTTTWAVTTAGALFEFDTQDYLGGKTLMVDSSHAVLFWTGFGSDGFAGTFNVNTTTWEITTSNAYLEFDATLGDDISALEINSGHFMAVWKGTDNDGFAQAFNVELVTSAIKTFNGLARASAKTVDGLALASVKTWNGLV